MKDALAHGMDIASGLHHKVADIAEIKQLADRLGRRIFDVRHSAADLSVGTGKKRGGKRILAVGSDCSVGKMYTTLSLEREMKMRGLDVDFRATGQTGILITGGGVPLDAVVADFMSGAVETLTPDNDDDHWDMIEGQGSLFHVSFSGVTMALIHGGQPDALILCHEPTRTHMRGLPGYALPSLEQLRDTALNLAQVANPACRVAGISVNTHALDDGAAQACLAEIEARVGLPAVDPYRQGAGRLVDALDGIKPRAAKELVAASDYIQPDA